MRKLGRSIVTIGLESIPGAGTRHSGCPTRLLLVSTRDV